VLSQVHAAAGDAEAAALERARQVLFEAREKRPKPFRDEKILASWNALMIEGLCAAYQATGTPAYLRAARRARS